MSYISNGRAAYWMDYYPGVWVTDDFGNSIPVNEKSVMVYLRQHD